MKEKIFVSGDHAGFVLKEKLKKWLESLNYIVYDFGPFEYRKEDDYPDYTFPLAEAVARTGDFRKAKGIVIAGSGIGEAIAANKVKGIRAVLYHGKSDFLIKTSRIHDDANVLCIGSRFLKEKDAKKAIKLWLNTNFPAEKRHKRRLAKIKKYESKNWKKGK